MICTEHIQNFSLLLFPQTIKQLFTYFYIVLNTTSNSDMFENKEKIYTGFMQVFCCFSYRDLSICRFWSLWRVLEPNSRWCQGRLPMYTQNVYSSFIFSSQRMENTSSFHQWTNTMWHICTIECYSAIKRRNTDKCYNLNEYRKLYIQWRKANTESHI